MRRVIRSMRLAAVLLAVGAPVAAQAPLPKAEELIQKAIAAMGGADMLRKHTESHMVAEFSIPAQGISGKLEAFSASNPNRTYSVIDIPGIGTIRSGYDGTVGWSMHPATGNSLITGNALEQLKQQADEAALLHPEMYFTSMETVERAQFAGKDAYKVKVKTKWGEEYVQHFDATSGLLLGNIRSQETPMGPIEVTTLIEDYKPVDGQLIPFRVRQSIAAMGVEQVITVNSIEFKVPDPSVFTLPAEIKALVK